MIVVLLVLAGGIWWKESNAFGVTHSNPAGKKMLASRNQLAGAGGTEAGSVTDVINVKSFGARGDGEYNDTAAIQAAIDAAGGKTRTVFIPPGEYKIDARKIFLFRKRRAMNFGVTGSISAKRQRASQAKTSVWLTSRRIGTAVRGCR